MITKLLQRLFGGGTEASVEDTVGGSEEYRGYRLEAVPRKDPQGWRIAGRVSREQAGEWQRVSFVRADVQGDWEDAVAMSLLKARRLVDERGEALFTEHE